MAEEIFRLGLYESKILIPLVSRGPGVYIQKMFTEGNSILSTLFVESLDVGASVYAEYFDFGVGGEVGEAVFLQAHDIVTTAVTSDRQLVTKMHNKPYIRLTVAGGNVVFGVYITVVVSQASDIDSALKKDNQIVSLPNDKGIPIVIYDTDSGRWHFAQGDNGVQDVHVVGNISIGLTGTPLFLEAATLTTPSTEQTLISYTVPASKTLNIASARVVCRQESFFEVYGDGTLIGSGRTGPASPNVYFDYSVSPSFVSGKIIEIKATARSGSPASSIEAYVHATLS